MSEPLRFVSLDEFVSVDEPGADPIVGQPGSVLIPEQGDVMIFGDGGAGKTTLQNDLAFHLAAGDDWCTLAVPRPVTVGIVENEGPRPLFREKLRRKVAAWNGSPLDGRLHVLDQPWAAFTFADGSHRGWLADTVEALELDIVFLGPLTRIGMNEAGTLQETRDFASLLTDVRNRCSRPITFSLTHHENKAGEVSGAWEGAGDTLLHVTGQGHGRTRLHIRKARWSSDWHGKTLNLVWADGESFTVDTQPERDDNTIADSILAAARANPGCSWRDVETWMRDNQSGIGVEQAKKVRDRLLHDGTLHNANQGRPRGAGMSLYDPTTHPVPQVPLEAVAPTVAPEDGGTHADGATGATGGSNSGTGSGTTAPPPSDTLHDYFPPTDDDIPF